MAAVFHPASSCGIVLTLVLLSLSTHACYFNSIISFGDSLADTGNGLYLSKSANLLPYYGSLPYGETFFHRPTGRCSDGRLIIDFIAEGLGLPFVEPFHGGNQSVSGVNFAVFGATALMDSFLFERGIQVKLPNVSLGVQIHWFKQFLEARCQESSDCRSSLATSLVLAGEIGGNDYNYAFLQGKSESQVRAFVPDVIRAIGEAITEFVDLGAATLLVPGNLPIGCSAFYLTYFMGAGEQDLDPETGCIKWLNRFSEHHNELLQMELNRIQKLRPQATIFYADYYSAAMNLYRSPSKYGFTGGGCLRACCGGGAGPYNVNLKLECGKASTNNCDDPSKYISWDGLHLTEAAHKWIAQPLLEDMYTSLSSICSFDH